MTESPEMIDLTKVASRLADLERQRAALGDAPTRAQWKAYATAATDLWFDLMESGMLFMHPEDGRRDVDLLVMEQSAAEVLPADAGLLRDFCANSVILDQDQDKMPSLM